MTSKPSNLTLKKWTLTLSKEAKESLLRQLHLPKSCLHSTNEFDKKPCPVGLDVCPTRVVEFVYFTQAETKPRKIRSHRQPRAFLNALLKKHQIKFAEFWDHIGPDDKPMAGDSQITLQQLEKTKHGADTSS